MENGRIEIVEWFVEKTRHLTQEEAAALVPGITQSDVQRWRRREYKRISAKKRQALERYRKEGSAPDERAAFREGAELVSERVVRVLRETLELLDAKWPEDDGSEELRQQAERRRRDAVAARKAVEERLGPRLKVVREDGGKAGSRRPRRKGRG